MIATTVFAGTSARIFVVLSCMFTVLYHSSAHEKNRLQRKTLVPLTKSSAAVGKAKSQHSTPGSMLYNGPTSLVLPTNSYSAELHVHGSFSEGDASMESVTEESRNVGLDVLWWSDHDGYFTQYHLVSSFSFEGWQEPASTNEDWTPNTAGEVTKTKSFELVSLEGMAMYEAAITPEEAHQGLNSLRMTGASSSTLFKEMLYRFSSQNNRDKRPVAAEVFVEISLLPRKITLNARPVIDILLSLHEPTPPATTWEQSRVRYFLSNDSLAVAYRNGSIYYVPVRYTTNAWNILSLPVTEDAIEGFSYLRGIDNALYEVRLGVESCMSDTTVVFFDDFNITAALRGDTLLNVQQIIMDSLQMETPEVTQLQAVEISEWVHLNEFGDGIDLPNYDSVALLGGYLDGSGWITDPEDFRTYSAQYVVQRAHDRGNVVSYNHLFGASSNSTGGPDPQTTVDDLATVEVYGADILEVGYRARGGHDLDTHLWVWDELAKKGLYLVGTGVGDSHGLAPGDWIQRTNNMISWIYADAPTRASLVDGLKRGRVYFGDLTQFDGKVDITTPQGFVMGQVVITDRTDAQVNISIDGLTAGDQIQTFWLGTLANTYVASGPLFNFTESHPVDSNGTFVRVVVTTPAADAKIFSNPIYFIRQAPSGGVSPFKAGVDMGDIHTTGVDKFSITSATRLISEGRYFLTIEGHGDNGTIVLNHTLTSTPDSVRFEDMSGTWALDDSLLAFFDLTGDGLIEISGRAAPLVLDIPDQSIAFGGSFAPIALDNFIDDANFPDDVMTWTVEGAAALSVTIDSNHVATIAIINPQWTGSETVTLIATDPEGLADSDTARFTVTPSTPVALRVNAGGSSYTTTMGIVFSADKPYVSGDFGYVGGNVFSILNSIAGTEDDALYKYYREGSPLSYLFDVSNGMYEVTCRFMEPYLRRSGRRLFDVKAEGLVVVDNLDLYVAAGDRRTAFDTTLTVEVTDSQLNLDFVPSSGRPPLICAIEVLSVASKQAASLTDNEPVGFALHQNFPNPFNPSTTIGYALETDNHVAISVFDLLGREVTTLVEAFEKRGHKVVSWDGTDNAGNEVSSGVYFCRLLSGNFVGMRKMLLVR